MELASGRHVLMRKAKSQPSDDHIAFGAGTWDNEMGVVVPSEVHYMPLAAYLGMGQPDLITVTVRVGNHMPARTD